MLFCPGLLRQPTVDSAGLDLCLSTLPLVFLVSGSRQTGCQRWAEQVGDAGCRQPMNCWGCVRRRVRPGAQETTVVGSTEPSGGCRVAGRLVVVSAACGWGLTQSGIDERQRRTYDVVAKSGCVGTGVNFLLATPLSSAVLKPHLTTAWDER